MNMLYIALKNYAFWEKSWPFGLFSGDKGDHSDLWIHYV